VAVVPLVAAGRQNGWLVLAQADAVLIVPLQAAAEQLAPLLAMRLQYELSHLDLLDRAAYIAALEQRIEASDAIRLRALLATGTAHDIGNIFTMLIGHAQLLQQDLPTSLQTDVGIIMRTAEDGRHLLRRLQSATPRFNTSAASLTALAAVIDEAVQFTRPLWDRSERQIAVHTVVHDTPLAHAPAADLREVLINLIMNAIAAMPNGGALTIGCDLVDDQAVVMVVDTGHGIPIDQQDEIFQPFMSMSEHGSGLGLSVSRVIIEGYGGTLTVSSAPGQGATFTIRLPASQRDRAVSSR
jgi:signal transduction histidine kinase